jgi:hypothetical protein
LALTDFRVDDEHDGIKMVPSIDMALVVDTLEGRSGPLMNAACGGCHSSMFRLVRTWTLTHMQPRA